MRPCKTVLVLTVALLLAPRLAPGQTTTAAEQGIVTLQSMHEVAGTLDRFEAAVRSGGWVVFTRIDHAAAARQAGLQLRPRTVVVFGNPRSGTAAMQGRPTLALDLPLRALVWEDDEGRVWLTRNSADYMGGRVYSRHGIELPPEARQGMETLLMGFGRSATAGRGVSGNSDSPIVGFSA